MQIRVMGAKLPLSAIQSGEGIDLSQDGVFMEDGSEMEVFQIDIGEPFQDEDGEEVISAFVWFRNK